MGAVRGEGRRGSQSIIAAMIDPTRKPTSRRRARQAMGADAFAPLRASSDGAGEAPSGDAGEGISKTRRKAQSHALQALGQRLVELPDGKLESIPLPDDLRRAILDARGISAREGRRRQLQYIGKLMRSADAGPIADALAVDGLAHRREVAAMHAAEAWRDGLLDGSRTLAAFVEGHPDAASRPLSQLITQARRERASGASGRHARTLYRHLLAAIDASGNDASGNDASGDGQEEQTDDHD